MGVSPWSVFHQGISKLTGITFGQASIISSFFIIFLVWILGLKPGLGTVLNMLFIGWIIDIFDYFGLITDAGNIQQGIMMIFLSMVFNGVGSCLYIGCGLGCGPIDGLMSVLTKKLRLPVGVIRFGIEATVFLIGWKLGGQVGLGTVFCVIGIGPIVQTVYRMLDFDITAVKHKTICKKKAIIE